MLRSSSANRLILRGVLGQLTLVAMPHAQRNFVWTFLYTAVSSGPYEGDAHAVRLCCCGLDERGLARVGFFFPSAPIATPLCRFVSFLAFKDCFPVHN